MGSLSIGHWLIVLVIVMLVFGTKKLANMGSDLGKAVKGFKDGVKNGDESVVMSEPAILSHQASHMPSEIKAKEIA